MFLDDIVNPMTMAEANNAYQRDYDSSRTGFGRREREDDEYHVPDPVEPEYNIKVNGTVINQQPFANRTAALMWAKQAVAAGKLDPKTATLSPINMEEARMSAAMKLQRAYQREQEKTAAERERGTALLNRNKQSDTSDIKKNNDVKEDSWHDGQNAWSSENHEMVEDSNEAFRNKIRDALWYAYQNDPLMPPEAHEQSPEDMDEEEYQWFEEHVDELLQFAIKNNITNANLVVAKWDNEKSPHLAHLDTVHEGWSDAIVSQRTGQPRTPYSVYIKGKKWKDFENDDHAENVANKLRAKFKAEGRDPNVITIAPTDYDKGMKEGDDLGHLDAEVFGRIDKEKQRRADLKKNDPAAYAKELEKDSKNYGRGIMGALRRQHNMPLDEFAPTGNYKPPIIPREPGKEPFEDDPRSQTVSKVQKLLDAGKSVFVLLPGAKGRAIGTQMGDDHSWLNVQYKGWQDPKTRSRSRLTVNLKADDDASLTLTPGSKFTDNKGRPFDYTLSGQANTGRGLGMFGMEEAANPAQQAAIAIAKKKEQEVDEHIGKVKGGYRLYSHKGKNLGTFPSKAGAEKHEREVNYFKHAEESVEKGHADQVKRVVKQGGKPVGEIGIDPEASPGGGEWYVKHYASGYDVVGFDTPEEALEELKYCMTQSVNEVKQRLDAKCWKGKHKEGTKIKGDVRVNNCVPNESIDEASVAKKPQPYNKDWTKDLSKEQLDKLAGPRYKKPVKESYWTKLQNERNTKIANLVNELTESIKDK